jgi:hypothetical protein
MKKKVDVWLYEKEYKILRELCNKDRPEGKEGKEGKISYGTLLGRLLIEENARNELFNTKMFEDEDIFF